MINFILGSVAGGLIACIVTISAARHPEIQSRLGLVPMAHAAFAPPPSHPEPLCAPAEKTAKVIARDSAIADALFSRQRFWYVAPEAK